MLSKERMKMRYVYTFKEIVSGLIEIESDHIPTTEELLDCIAAGNAAYTNTELTDFVPVEVSDKP